MRNVQWQTKEVFIFPSTVGAPTNVATVNVTPRFTIDRSTDNLRMTGIYHLTANVEFDEEVSTSSSDETVIVVEDVEIDAESKLGYFEYAVPFNIDLPPEAADPLDMAALNTTYEIDDGQLAVIWDVECTYKEVVVIPDQELVEKAEREVEEKEAKIVHNSEQEEKAKPEVVVENTAFSEGDEVLAFISELDDNISTTSFHLNDVLVQSKG